VPPVHDPADPEVLRAIGRVIFQFSQLEARLFTCTSELVDPADQFISLVILARENFSRLEELFATLLLERIGCGLTERIIREQQPEIVAAIRDKTPRLLEAIKHARESRNALLHAKWQPIHR